MVAICFYCVFFSVGASAIARRKSPTNTKRRNLAKRRRSRLPMISSVPTTDLYEDKHAAPVHADIYMCPLFRDTPLRVDEEQCLQD